ncbi:MAG: hypothetical protein K0U98_09840 [Deltaproteobacteria bacterium]|nr:hypothetical protein [Deltaproteobacteria bacterium]
MKRPLLLYGVPLLVLLIFVLAPIISGERTLFLRDAFHEHLGLKSAQAQAMEEGSLPLVAPQIAGGQPLIGNPNVVPLYPDNLFYLLTPFLWAFNAHFWIHLLLAPIAMYALARAWGIQRQASWVAGFSYGLSGFFLSNLNLYNLVAGAALAPALVAAALYATTRGAKRDRVALALLWALVLLAGEPLIAALVLALAATAVLLRHCQQGLELRPFRPFASRFGPTAGALACGTLLAAPQWVELLRILPLSVRGHQGFSLATRTAASFHPGQALEWFLPLCFGRPDQLDLGSFWAYSLYGGFPPLYFSLYPGLLVLALLPFSGLQRNPVRLWAWLSLAGSLFLALGRSNPLLALLLQLPGGSLLRYPIKMWLPAAMALAILAGLGFERWSQLASRQEKLQGNLPPDKTTAGQSRGRGLSRLLSAFAAAYLVLWAWLRFLPTSSNGFLKHLIPDSFGSEFIAQERSRWMGLALLCMLLAFSMSLITRIFARRRAGVGGALLLLLHGGSQLFLLQPLLATEESSAFLRPSSLLEDLPEQTPIVHGSADDLFGRVDARQANFPKPTSNWVHRRTFLELYPSSGIFQGRRYELNLTPEGLSSFLSRAARDAILQLDDVSRVKLLKAWGVGRLLLSRPLIPAAAAEADLLTHTSVFGNELRLYGLPDASPEVFLASRIHYAPNLNGALTTLTDPSFSPQRDVVLPGSQPTLSSSGGELHRIRLEQEILEVEVTANSPGAIVWQRSHLSIYRATIDDSPVPIAVANLHRIAVPIPEGEHRIRIWVDRRPFRIAVLVALLGLVGIVALGRYETASIGAP